MRRTLAGLMAAGALAAGTLPAAAAEPGPALPASGAFTVGPDATVVGAQPVGGNKCRLAVTGTLYFTGTLQGAATGTTTAVVHGTCAEVSQEAPGTRFDTFRFEGDFGGTVAGDPVSGGTLTYSGVTRPGGHIDALITLSGGGWAVLRSDATVLVGGTYAGRAKP